MDEALDLDHQFPIYTQYDDTVKKLHIVDNFKEGYKGKVVEAKEFQLEMNRKCTKWSLKPKLEKF